MGPFTSFGSHAAARKPSRGPSRRSESEAGFTLIEMIVAVGLFAVVMLVCTSALLSLVDANKKAQAMQSVTNNLNVAVDGMVRAVRMGTDYHCGASGISSSGMVPADCSQTGDTTFAFEPYHNCSDPGTTCDNNGNVPPWVYWYATDSNGIGRLYKSEDGTLVGIPVTAPEVSIDSVQFYVIGSPTGDGLQPKMLVVIKGSAGNTKVTVHTTFHIQATAVQRVLDI
jgi:prepilin-type N-terminal cleavage/methylation domain-containing protein